MSFEIVRGLRVAIAGCAIGGLTFFAAGCNREERGPILLGGREVKSWVADLESPKPQVRRMALIKLGNVGNADPAVAEAMMKTLDDKDPIVRRDAVVAVSRLEQWPPKVVERLEAMARSDRDSRARELADQAISRRKALK